MTVELPQWDQVQRVMPEIWLVIAMCAVLLVPFVRRRSVLAPVVVTMVGLVLALVYVPMGSFGTGGTVHVFSGMLTIDPFSNFFKVLLLAFTLFVVAQWLMTSQRETAVYDVPDFMCLLLGATVGMALMASASNLLMIFIAIEAASMPSFALAGFRKHHRRSTEGALKYVLFGAASSAVSVYGMSLIYGAVGSLDLSQIAYQASVGGVTPLLAVGMLAMFAGIAFKLSAVPLHFWCPDVFEGAPIEITTFLSVASKGAAVCLLLRILYAFSFFGGEGHYIGLATAVAILGGVTATWGNLVALHQGNIKRLLAYSSIAHAGYMIMAASLAAVVAVGDSRLGGAILFYLVVYMFMNLGAFTVVGLVARQTGSEDLRDYSGLMGRSPALAVLLSLFLLSLFGMPGLGGFMAKIFLGMAMFSVAKDVAFVLIIVLFINTVISLYYYMRPVYYMAFVKDEENRMVITPQAAGFMLLLICALALVWTGLLPTQASDLTEDYATIIVREAPGSALSLVEPVVAAVPGNGH